ncbi:MAG: NUDIX hydrolase [Actinomycetota bacterium]
MVGRRRAARVVVFDPSDRVLLIEGRDPAGRVPGRWWEIPGGGMDPGEDSASTARRELWEEAGIREAEIGPCVWIQQVQYTFGGFHFDQDEFIHVARCDGTTTGPGGLEHLEALAFGEQRWWAVGDFLDHGPRTIPYRMLEFIADLASGVLPSEPIDISPEDHHVEQWRASHRAHDD